MEELDCCLEVIMGEGKGLQEETSYLLVDALGLEDGHGEAGAGESTDKKEAGPYGRGGQTALGAHLLDEEGEELLEEELHRVP